MRTSLHRRRFLGLLGATAGLGAAGVFTAPSALAAPDPWRPVANDVRAQTRAAWRSYVDKAFGHDQIKPVSGGFEEFFVDGHPMGLTVVEALDTLWLMELDTELEQGLDWVRRNLSFDV